MEDFLNQIQGVLDTLINQFISGESSLITPAKIVASFGVLISIYMIWRKSTARAEPIEEDKLFRIFIIYLGIIFYGTFIRSINFPLQYISDAIKFESSKQLESANTTLTLAENRAFDENEAMEEKLNQVIVEVKDELDIEESAADPSSEISKSIETAFDPQSIYEKFKAALMRGLFEVINFFGYLALIVLTVIRSFFLIVLSYFGIFVLALSTYPGLENTFFQWLQKYINVFLWLPVAYILQNIIGKLFSLVNVAGDAASSDAVIYSNVSLLLVGLCSIVGYAAVPTMSSWLVNAATTSAASRVKKSAMSSGGVAGKAVKGVKGVFGK